MPRRAATLSISVRWGTTGLHAAQHTPPATYTVGESATLPWGYPLPASILGRQRARLVRVEPSTGDVWLVVLPGATGTLTLPDEPEASLRDHLGRGGCSVAVDEASELRLPEGATAMIVLGEISFEIEHRVEVHEVARPHGHAGHGFGFVAAIAAIALHAGVLNLSKFHIPDLPDAETSERGADQRYEVRSAFADPALTEPDEPVATPAPSGDDREEAHSRCGEDDGGSMGSPAARVAASRYGVRGPVDNADPHIPLSTNPWHEYADWFGLSSKLAWESGDLRAPIMSWGRSDALGTDPTSASGNMWGDTIAAAFGSNGVGVGRAALCAECGGTGNGPHRDTGTTGGGATGREAASRLSPL